MLKYGLHPIIIFFLAVVIGIIDNYFSTLYGYLSQPIINDGVAYCIKGKDLYNTFVNEGVVSFFGQMLSLREPLWDGLIGFMHIILNSNSEYTAYLARIVPIFIILLTVFFLARKISEKTSFAYLLVLITAFIPIVSPNIRKLFFFGDFFNYQVLTDMRPDFLWGALLTATIVYLVEKRDDYTIKYFAVAGLLASLTILAKGSTAPFLFSSVGISGLFILIVNRKLGWKRPVMGIAVALLIISFFVFIWWLNGGLESNIKRIIGTYTNTQIVRDQLPYISRLKRFLTIASYHLGKTEIILACISFVALIINMLLKRKIYWNALIYLVVGVQVMMIMSTKNSNLLNSAPVSLFIYLAFIATISHLFKDYIKLSKKGNWILYGTIALFIVGKLLLMFNGKTIFYNKAYAVNYTQNLQSQYFDLMQEVDSYTSPRDVHYQNFYLFGGVQTFEYYLDKKIPRTGLNINHQLPRALEPIDRCKVILLDRQGESGDNKVHPKRRKHVDALYNYLETSDKFTLQKTYNLKFIQTRNIYTDDIKVRDREILFYLRKF